MLTRKACLLAKIETTPGIDAVPTVSADEIFVMEPSWAHESTQMNERTEARPSAGKLQSVHGGNLKTITFSMNMRGPGAAYSATVRPEADVCLRACGFGATIDTTASSETATYAPVSSGYEYITLYLYKDGQLHKVTGCQGNVSFSMDARGFVVASFTFTGHDAGVTDATFPTPSYDSTVPPKFVGMAFAVGGYSAIINSFNYDMGNTLAMPPSANATDGFALIQNTGRAPGGSFDPENVLIATNDFIGDWKAGSLMALATGNAGSTQYNKFSQSMPAIYYNDISQGDRDGIDSLGVDFSMAESTTDDEVSIVFS